MSFYSQVIFPRLCDLLLDRPAVAKLRGELLAHTRGEVLEIGFGTGLNLACYPDHVRRINAVDANPGMHRLARRRIHQAGIEVRQHVASCERLPFNDRMFDCAVSTFTLCSVERVDRAIAELHRVLKPGGRFLFLEHGLSPEPAVRKWQRRLNWLEMNLADGCRLDRDMRGLVTAQFAAADIAEFYLAGIPWTHGYMYRGIASKAP
ncbi:MAG: class I SAM-dependent methyltransferase [Gemmataceae bacterium]|nr:class I SAM-dependent methyltransferase [Gemmataceae bacterium]